MRQTVYIIQSKKNAAAKRRIPIQISSPRRVEKSSQRSRSECTSNGAHHATGPRHTPCGHVIDRKRTISIIGIFAVVCTRYCGRKDEVFFHGSCLVRLLVGLTNNETGDTQQLTTADGDLNTKYLVFTSIHRKGFVLPWLRLVEIPCQLRQRSYGTTCRSRLGNTRMRLCIVHKTQIDKGLSTRSRGRSFGTISIGSWRSV